MPVSRTTSTATGFVGWLETAPLWQRVVILSLISALLTGLLLARTDVLKPGHPAWEEPIDHHKYIHIAEAPIGTFHINPTCRRLGIPLLVKALPFSAVTGYALLTFVFTAATGVLLFFFLSMAAGYTTVESLVGCAMYFSYGAVTKLILAHAPYSPEAATFFLLLLALFFIYRNNDIALAVTLAIGAVVKETLILVVPLAYTLRATRFIDVRLAVRTVMVAVPAILVLAGIRAMIPAWNDAPEYVAALGPQLTTVHLGTSSHSYMDALQRVTAERLQASPIDGLRELTWGSGGLLWVLPFFGLMRGAKTERLPAQQGNLWLFIRALPLIAVSYLGFFMALNFDRRLAFIFPFLIMLSLNAVNRISDRTGVPRAAFIAVFGVQYLLNLLQPLTPKVPFDIAAGVFLCSVGILLSLSSGLVRQLPLQGESSSTQMG